MVKFNKKELEKLIGVSKDLISNDLITTNKKRTAFDRLNDAVKIMNSDNSRDKIFFNEDFSACIIEFHNIAFLSNNDLLRIDNRHLYKFKMSWNERLSSLLNNLDISNWNESKKGKILIEFLYKTKNSQIYDPDSIISAFKSTLDGIVNVGLLEDDKVENVPLIIPRQEKTKNENSLIVVMSRLNNVEKYYTDNFNNVLKAFT